MKINRFLQFIIAFSMFIGLETSWGKTLCIEKERQALVQFKQGVIDEYDILSSWGREEEKQECCRWKGVKCSNKTGHVVMVDIHHYLPQTYLDVDRHLKGNNELCGPPLEKCPVHDDHTSRTNNVDEDDDMLLSFGFYVSVCSGVIVGFWGVIFTLVFNKSCRDAYFHLFINIVNWIFVTTIMCLRRLKMLWS
ncbi:hypothetical protein H5410_028737 [Solanum commersonii]|uniref:Leucine-rich repeat-containing N-terminal plant-type domain-containing protein n=1 Tax=Solanum commersonii TaxID=4109 RepID=A0A9J5Z4V0_SOLCO|nr:hypothetical protein H5410_028737 [Solanum commersonii]